GQLNDLWRWNGSWQLVQANDPSVPCSEGAARPCGRERPALANGDGFNLLFGGRPSDLSGLPALGDTWSLNAQQWALATATAGPIPRSAHTLTFDSARRRVTLFGGRRLLLGQESSNE